MERVLGQFLWDPGPMIVTISKIDFVTLEFARNADLVGEKGGCTINK